MTHIFRASLILIYILVLARPLHGQTDPLMIPGEYHLRGVMEVASGFRFNADSTFDFFFSYGAVDREGHGHWRRDGNSLVLNSAPRTTPDFILHQQRTQRPATELTIQVTDPNTNILGFIHAQLRLADGATINAESDPTGKIVFTPPGKPVELSLLHALWPNQPLPFALTDPAVNYYEFTLNPQIVDVGFRNLVLRTEGGNLVGAHPLMEEEEFTYVRGR